uniref:Unkown protein n=1 Tax=Riptortus pedestris TaxID=329032 RepID=R4WPF5_RIPPE|nr:unkown protein [Riptortus pedestris]
MSRRTQDKDKAALIKAVMLQTKAVYYPSKRLESPPEGWIIKPVDCDEVYPNLFIGDKYDHG